MKRFAVAALLMMPAALMAQKRNMGESLAKSCKELISVSQAPNADQLQLSAVTGYYCMGYFDSLVLLVNHTNSGICLPEKAQVLTVVKVYSKWMEDNPKFNDEQSAVGVYRALRENYPCASK